MVISEVINKLQEIQKEHGDLEVTIKGWCIEEDDFYSDKERHKLDFH